MCETGVVVVQREEVERVMMEELDFNYFKHPKFWWFSHDGSLNRFLV